MYAAARRSGLKVIKIPKISTVTPKRTNTKKINRRIKKFSIGSSYNDATGSRRSIFCCLVLLIQLG
jgi:hypothetical protein